MQSQKGGGAAEGMTEHGDLGFRLRGRRNGDGKGAVVGEDSVNDGEDVSGPDREELIEDRADDI